MSSLLNWKSDGGHSPPFPGPWTTHQPLCVCVCPVFIHLSDWTAQTSDIKKWSNHRLWIQVSTWALISMHRHEFSFTISHISISIRVLKAWALKLKTQRLCRVKDGSSTPNTHTHTVCPAPLHTRLDLMSHIPLALPVSFLPVQKNTDLGIRKKMFMHFAANSHLHICSTLSLLNRQFPTEM